MPPVELCQILLNVVRSCTFVPPDVLFFFLYRSLAGHFHNVSSSVVIGSQFYISGSSGLTLARSIIRRHNGLNRRYPIEPVSRDSTMYIYIVQYILLPNLGTNKVVKVRCRA